MAIEIKVPTLGESVTEATVAKWFKKPGDAVAADEPLVELETDKVTVEVNAPPAVRKLVDDNNLDPARIAGTGKDGRITKGDVLAAIEAGTATKQASPPAAPAAAPVQAFASSEGLPPRPDDAREERVRMTKLRKVIAGRLKEAQQTAAMLTTWNEVDMGAAMDLRATYKEAFEKKHGVKLGFMGFFVRAACIALKEWPAVNAEIYGDELVYKNYYNIGVAVGTPQGLVVPVIKDADQLRFSEIEGKISDFGRRARDGPSVHRRDDGRHLHHLQRRCLRLAQLDADPQRAAVRHPRHAQDPETPDGRRRRGRHPTDDVPGAELRSSHHRRPRGGIVPRPYEGMPRGPAAHPAGCVIVFVQSPLPNPPP